MNTEERQLAEMLHRVTPEPPRGVTVKTIAPEEVIVHPPGKS